VERTEQIDVMELLRARGLRMTPQRRAIVSAVMHAQGHISPTAITRKIQSEMPGVNASTVYRTLTLLEDVGVRVADLRRARYFGLARTRLQHVLTAAALNIHRLAAWLRLVRPIDWPFQPYSGLIEAPRLKNQV
jgi:Fe2+ or Zn2+ uptake regulation protein